jgi:hypothetical protein
MGAEGLLSRVQRWAAAAVSLALMALTAVPAQAKRKDRNPAASAKHGPSQGLIRPRRITIGDHNHFMGVLGPGARYIYYVTDEYNSYDLFIQSPLTSSGKPLFEAFGDIVWPAISPDGRELAYIRYEKEARGDACRRRIASNGKARNKREDCRETDEADLQIYWRHDGRLGVLMREELHGDHVLLDGAFEKHPTRKDANVVGFALSPDDRWVAFVPLSKRREDIGVSFSNQISTEGIQIRRAVPGAEDIAYDPELPGVSAYPSFSPDGSHLYFSQFLNDTNRDGRIDGDDNGVVFRVPFFGDGEQPELGLPQQLTNARWNCHYPSVRQEAMAVTCGIEGNLHIYILPPSGAVPAEWDQARIAAQAEKVQNPWNALLLRQHLLVAANDADERSEELKALTRLHLGLREFEAAIHYAELRKKLLESSGVADPWSELMILYARHRRADRGLSQGVLSEEFVRESMAAGAAAEAIDREQSPNVAALRSLVLARIRGDAGDKEGAAEQLASVELNGVDDESVVDFAQQELDRFYGLLADYETRLRRSKEAALHPASSVTQSLRHSRAFLDLLQRGRPKEERLGRLVEAREAVPEESRLAMALDLEIALHALTPENAVAVEEEIVRLYTSTNNAHVRRYIVVSALRASQREGVESLQQSLTERWVESIDSGDPERETSTALYEIVVMERAYGAFSSGDFETAAEYFDRARRITGSPAAHAGWIDSQLALGATDVRGAYKRYFREDPDGPPAYHAPGNREFVEAYILARDLGSIERNAELSKTVDRVQELLRRAIEEDPHQAVVHLLLAHALHHRGMRVGSREDTSSAVRHYFLAEDLAARRPRVRAPVHAGMALAQASLGNHRRALRDYEARFELPFTSKEEEIGLLIAYARSLFHVNQKPRAIQVLRVALLLADETEELGRFQPLVLDRLALYELDAGEMDAALETHSNLAQSLDSHPEVDSAVNEVKTKARLAAAHLAADHPAEAFGFASEGRQHLAAADPLRPPDIDRRPRPVTHEFVYDEDQLLTLLAGLEASAARQLADWNAARESLLVRKRQLEKWYEEEEVDEALLELALTCLRLAEVGHAQGDLELTREYLEEGLADADKHRESTGTEVSEVGFHLLRAYAGLHFDGGVELALYQRDLERDLLRYYRFLSEVRNPQWEAERLRLEILLSLLRMEQDPGP